MIVVVDPCQTHATPVVRPTSSNPAPTNSRTTAVRPTRPPPPPTPIVPASNPNAAPTAPTTPTAPTAPTTPTTPTLPPSGSPPTSSNDAGPDPVAQNPILPLNAGNPGPVRSNTRKRTFSLPGIQTEYKSILDRVNDGESLAAALNGVGISRTHFTRKRCYGGRACSSASNAASTEDNAPHPLPRS